MLRDPLLEHDPGGMQGLDSALERRWDAGVGCVEWGQAWDAHMDPSVGCGCGMHIWDGSVGCIHWIHALDGHVGYHTDTTRIQHVGPTWKHVLDTDVGCTCWFHALDAHPG